MGANKIPDADDLNACLNELVEQYGPAWVFKLIGGIRDVRGGGKAGVFRSLLAQRMVLEAGGTDAASHTVAEELGYDEKGYTNFVKILNGTTRHGQPLTEGDEIAERSRPTHNSVVALADAGLPEDQIAAKVGKGNRTVRRHLVEDGLREPGQHGRKGGNTRAQVVALHEQGKSVTQISAELGCSKQNVREHLANHKNSQTSTTAASHTA